MKHLGDISKINGAEVEPVDVITFGSPCQDLSVAGKRAGLKHEANGDGETTRSGLFMEAVRIIREMREATDGKYPRFALWENVPGAFSSNKGEDFRVVLEELIKISEPGAVMPEVPKKGWAYADSYVGDGWSLAYRVFDTQYWPRTPQRRRRIYLVADFRGQCAREVLFERKGLRGHLTESPAPRERITAYVEAGSGAADRERVGVGIVNAIGGNAENYHLSNQLPTLTNGTAPGFMNAVAYSIANQHEDTALSKTAVIDNIGGQAEYGKMSEVNGTLRAGAQGAIAYCYDARGNGDGETVSTITGDHEKSVSDYTSIVVEQYPFCKSSRAKFADDATTWKEGEVANTLNTFDLGEVRANELVVEKQVHESHPIYSLQGNTIDRDAKQNGSGVGEGISHTLNSVDRHGVVYCMAHGQANAEVCEEVSPCLNCNHEQPIIFDKEVYQSGENASGGHYISEGGPAPTLRSTGHVPGVCVSDEEYPREIHEFVAENNSDAPHQQDLIQTADGVARTIACGTHAAGSHLTKTIIKEGPHYIVRRLTPTECARLQGFSDKWGHPDKKDSLNDEEYEFWLEVRNTHAAINGKAAKEYTRDQILKWYNKLHSDSSEYKMWGNGIALPPSLYCMQGMAEVLDRRGD